MDQAKVLITKQKRTHFSLQTFISNKSLKLLINKNSSALFISGLRLLQSTGVIALSKKSGLLKLIGLQRLVSYLPKLDKAIKPETFYPATASEPGVTADKQTRGNVALFTGCLSNTLDPKTVKASIRLLNKLGYGVYVPPQQTCCGALDLHEGNKKQADKFANININIFNQQDNISAVNGCTSQLREYSQLGISAAFTPVVKDIIEFLADIDWPENIEFKPLKQTIGLQIPCSLQNILRAEDKLMALLHRIPGINLSPESIYNRCCGAAGSYFLRFPQLSEQLSALALTKLQTTSPDMIVSSNLGCALQLKAGLNQSNSEIKVIHPVLLLEQQLKIS